MVDDENKEVYGLSNENTPLQEGDANNIFVDPNGLDTNNGFSWETPVKTIATGLSKVNAGGVVHLANGTHNVTTSVSISKTVTIIGQNETIITNNAKNCIIFSIAYRTSNVEISNCIFLNNTAYSAGVAIANSGVNSTIRNCSFINNKAVLSGYYGGGAIYNTNNGLNLKIVNCRFINNTETAKYSAGGGAIYNSGENVTISNCSFINNTGPGGVGGAIYNANNGLNLKIVECRFINNNASSGGAIYNYASNFMIINSSFINNNATSSNGGAGGAIGNSGANSGVIGSSFINNTAYSDGGAISASASSFMVNNCSFINNTITLSWGTGGAIYIAGTSYTNSKVINSRFINNTAGGNGGAIYNRFTTKLMITNCTFINNKLTRATSTGGAFTNSGNNCVLDNNYFDNNSAVSGTAVYNSASINLTNNKYSGIGENQTYIYNTKTILTPVVITILENNTINTKYNDQIQLVASITADNGISVSGGTLKFIIGDAVYEATSNGNGTYNYTYTVDFSNDYKIVNAYYTNNNNITVLTSILDTRVVPDVNVSVGDIVYGNDLIVKVNVTSKATGNVTIAIKNNGSIVSINTISLDDAKNYIVPDDVKPGNYTADVTYNGDVIYAIFTNSTEFNIAKISNFNITSKIDDIKIGGNVTINVTVPSRATGNVTTTINGKSYNATIKEGKAIIENISGLSADTYYIEITYGGDDVYESKTTKDNFTVFKLSNYTININNPTTSKVGQNVTIKVTISANDAEGNVTIKVGSVTHNITLENGVASVNITNLTAGEHDIIVNYTGNDKYESKINTSSVNVSKISDYELSIDTESIKVGENATIIVTVPKDAKGKINITVEGDNHIYTSDIITGVARFTVPGLGNGTHVITATFDGDNKYLKNQNTSEIIVFKVSDFNMTIDVPTDVKVGDVVVINVTLPGDAGGDVVIKVGDVEYNATVEDGFATIVTDELTKSGIYNITATYNGNNKYVSKDANKTSIDVSKVDGCDMNITIPDEIKTGENTTITVDLPEDATGNVTVTINTQNYTSEVKNGIANITISNLPIGNYNVTIAYSGDNKYVPVSANKTINVTSNGGVNLTANDVVMIYKDGSRLYATLLDSRGNPIANTTISFTINGVTYNRTTDENGSASIALNLEHGLYKAVISCVGNETYNSTSVEVNVTINSSIKADDLVKMYKNDTQFSGIFMGENGKPLVNTTVRFNINGVFYNRTTDKNGIAILNINLNPGNYTITVYNPVNGEQCGFNVLVKSLIESNDLTKYYQNASKFETTVYNKDGSLAINKTVTFNINGVFYKRTTDANGIAKLAINLRPGNYTITTMYDGLSVGNNVNILPTLITGDLSMKYNDGSVFSAKTLDAQGNPLANQNITYNVNGVFYHKTTGSDGIANLNINLMKGEYIITSMYGGYQIGNTIKIL